MKKLRSESSQPRKTLLSELVRQLQQKQGLPKVAMRREVQVNPEDVRKQMRSSWRDGGYANLQFGQLMPLKAEMLSEWQIERLPLSKRSYSTPKNCKMLKFHTQSKEFGSKNDNQHSQKFLKKLKKARMEHQDKLFKPKPAENKKYKQTLQKYKCEGMKVSTSSNFFGLAQRMKAGSSGFKSFKSEVFLRKKDFLDYL